MLSSSSTSILLRWRTLFLLLLLLLPLQLLHAFVPTIIITTTKSTSTIQKQQTISCPTTRHSVIIVQQGWNDDDNDDDGSWGNAANDVDAADDDGWNSPPSRHQQRFRNIRHAPPASYSSGGHDYQRDPSDSTNSIDVAAVDRLLSMRLAAKKRRDFDTADAIRDQLRDDFSVRVYDREKVWTTSSNRGRYSGGGGGSFSDRGRGGRSQWGGAQRGGGRRRGRQDFGPLGHDYRLSPDAELPTASTTTLEEDTIHQYLAERLQAKLARNYPEADRILQVLWQAGVRVHDGRKEWRADGQGFGQEDRADGRPGRSNNNTVRRTEPYTQSPQSEDTTNDDTAVIIQDLVDRRLAAKSRRDFPEADALREELRETFGVLVNDRLRQWSIGNHFGNDYNSNDDDTVNAPPMVYTMSSLSVEPIDDAQATAIQDKVDERVEARRARDYDTADAIRAELMDIYHVIIQDKLGEWSIGGEFEGFGRRKSTSFTRRGGGSIDPEEETTVLELIGQRAAAKSDRDYDTADALRERLFQEYNVKVDDRAREWMVVSEDYRFDGDEASVDPDTLTYIRGRLRERFQHKNNREYELADAIREELQETYAVSINDRICEWTIDGGSGRSRGTASIPASRNGQEQRYGSSGGRQMEFTYKEIDDDDDDDATASVTSATETTATETIAATDDDFFASMSSLLDADVLNDGDDASVVTSTAAAVEDEVTYGPVEPASAANANANAEDLTSLTVPKLKELLREAGLPVSGRKAELVERLLSR